MKLFVDDIRHMPDDSWVGATTINSAITFIDTFSEKIDVISLDHDISHQVSVGTTSRPYPCEETYTAVAYFIKAKYQDQLMAQEMKKSGIISSCLNVDCPERKGGDCWQLKTPKIIIHTSNPAGAVKMAGILKDFEVERREAGFANRLEMTL